MLRMRGMAASRRGSRTINQRCKLTVAPSFKADSTLGCFRDEIAQLVVETQVVGGERKYTPDG